MKNGLLLVMVFLFVCSCTSFHAIKSSRNSKEHWQRMLEQTMIPMDIPDLNLCGARSSKPTETDDTESFFFNNFQSKIKIPIFIDPSIATNIMASGEIRADSSTPGYISALKVLDTICRLDGLEYKITDDGIFVTKSEIGSKDKSVQSPNSPTQNNEKSPNVPTPERVKQKNR